MASSSDKPLTERLKERKLVQWALAYLAGGWLILQVLDVTAEPWGLSVGLVRSIQAALTVGFFVTLVFAWYHGEQGRQRVSGPELLIIGGLLLVSGLGLRLFAYMTSETAGSSELEATATEAFPLGASLAVLPFADLSPEGDQEYFGDGIAEAILNVLASLDGLSVASRTSAFAFRDENRNVAEIANILDVAYVLEGSVRKAGSQVLTTAQLIDASTDRHLWSDTFERELTTENLFAIQEEIANAIATALNDELELGLQSSLEVPAITGDLDAYDLFLQAQQLVAISSTENVRRQIQLAERAVELDPGFAEAWAFLGEWLNWLPTWDHTLESADYHRRAIVAAEQALELHPSNSTAFGALAAAYYQLNDFERYEEVVGRARSLAADFERNPSLTMGLGYLSRAYEEATDWAAREPDIGFHNLLRALYLEAMGQSAEAIDEFELAIAKGYNGGAEWQMASAYWDAGDSAVWTAIWARELLANDPELLPLLPYMRSLLMARPVENPMAASTFRAVARELGFDVEDLVQVGPRFGLRIPEEVAVAIGESEPVAEGYWSNYPKMWMWSQRLHEFRQSEAFRSRVRESGMLAYWREHGWPDLCQPAGREDFVCD